MKAVENITAKLEELQKSMPGYEFHVISNQGDFIGASIGEVKDSAVMGILLAMLVLYVFLRRINTTLIVSVSIPVSIIATFNLMYFNGLTINIMTLGGLALGAGMLIDNAIVVMENIFRNQRSFGSFRGYHVFNPHDHSGILTYRLHPGSCRRTF